MAYDVKKQHLEKQPVLYKEGSGPSNQIPQLMGKLLNEVTSLIKGTEAKVMPQPFTRYVSEKEDQVTMWVGFRVRTETKVKGLKSAFLPGGDAVITEHNGTYDTLQDAHKAVLDFIESKKLTRDGEPWEFYYSDPDKETNRTVGRTVVVFPVK